MIISNNKKHEQLIRCYQLEDFLYYKIEEKIVIRKIVTGSEYLESTTDHEIGIYLDYLIQGFTKVQNEWDNSIQVPLFKFNEVYRKVL